jgi:hypothetical protein
MELLQNHYPFNKMLLHQWLSIAKLTEAENHDFILLVKKHKK